LPLARTAKALLAETTAARRGRHFNSQHTRNLARRATALANRSAWIFICCLEFPVRVRGLSAFHYPATVKPVKLNRQIKVSVNNAQTQNDILLCVAELSSNNSSKFFGLAESLLFFSEDAFSKVLAREQREGRSQNSERRMPRAAIGRHDRKLEELNRR
jgi:hypothetical protein